MKPLFKILVIALSITYPFLVYWGLQHYQASKLIPLLLILLVFRWLEGGRSSERKVLIAIFISLLIISIVWGHQLGLKFYPVMVNLGFLILFASTLISPPSIVERMARVREPDLSPQGVVYTRKVTWVWTGFFVLNGSIAAVTAIWASNEVWILYNGFIAYLLIGLLIGGEWIVRRRVIRD